MDEFQDPLQLMAASHVDAVYRTVDSVGPALERAARLLIDCMLEGNKTIGCGVGQASALAQMFCGALIGTVRIERPALPAVCIGADAGSLAAPDGESGRAQTRALQAIGNAGDVLVLIVPPGAEQAAGAILRMAEGREMPVVLLRAERATPADAAAIAATGIELLIPETDPQRVMECALVLLNCLAALIEARLFGDG